MISGKIATFMKIIRNGLISMPNLWFSGSEYFIYENSLGRIQNNR